MQNVAMLSVIYAEYHNNCHKLSVIMLNAITLNVLAPYPDGQTEEERKFDRIAINNLSRPSSPNPGR